MFLDVDIRLRPDARSPAEARRSLEALRPSLDDHLVDDAVLLVSELVSNCVHYAKLDPTDAIQVRIRRTSSMLHVDVVDPGRGFDPDALPSARTNGGWGLRLLDRLSSRWGVERNHVTRVWFELTSSVSTSTASGT